MGNKLENLREQMNETIFRDVSFDEKQYQKVLNSINKTKNKTHISPWKNKFNMVLSVSVVSFMAVGLTYFVGSQINTSTGTGEGPVESTEDVTKYVPPVQEENFDEMTKEEILTKMINTVDHFETASGEYKMHYGNIPSEYEVEYTVSLNKISAGFSKRTENVNGNKVLTSEYYKAGSNWTLSDETKTFRESKYTENENYGTALTIDEAFSENSTNYRERPPIGVAHETLFPYEIASNYTRDLNSWEIEKQNEELLGHNTLVIKGNINHRDFQSFRFWVDKDTGILVKYETYKSTGDVVDYLYPSRLEVNIPIDSEQFTPNLDGYKVDPEFYEGTSKMTTGDVVDNFIPEEYKEQWEEAKKKPNETSVFRFGEQYDQWYIVAKKGYVVDRIETDGGKEGVIYLKQASGEKSQTNFLAIAEGYLVDTLKVVYE